MIGPERRYDHALVRLTKFARARFTASRDTMVLTFGSPARASDHQFDPLRLEARTGAVTGFKTSA
jgi:hypothetical protein